MSGTSAADSIVLDNGQVKINGAVAIRSSNVELFCFNVGAQGSGNLEGTSGLIKMGPGILVVSGTVSYTGGTAVNDGTLQVDSADALPPGTSLTIGMSGSVVLASDLGQAIELSGLSFLTGASSSASSLPAKRSGFAVPIGNEANADSATLPFVLATGDDTPAVFSESGRRIPGTTPDNSLAKSSINTMDVASQPAVTFRLSTSASTISEPATVSNNSSRQDLSNASDGIGSAVLNGPDVLVIRPQSSDDSSVLRSDAVVIVPAPALVNNMVTTPNETSPSDWDLIAASIAQKQHKPKRQSALDEILAATADWQTL